MTGDAMFNLTIESNDSSDYTAGMTELAWLFWLMRKPRIQGPCRHGGDQWSQIEPHPWNLRVILWVQWVVRDLRKPLQSLG